MKIKNLEQKIEERIDKYITPMNHITPINYNTFHSPNYLNKIEERINKYVNRKN